jgi:hypothetical protein
MFFDKLVDQIDLNDLQRLLGEEEDQTLDFKQTNYISIPESVSNTDLSKIKDKWKHDLCTDVCALANARGGWIICGVKEERGQAVALDGVRVESNESEKLRLRQCIESGTEPKLTTVQIHFVDLDTTVNQKILIIFVPRSYLAPHRVKATNKFPIRRFTGNDYMDVTELRAAFNLSGNFTEAVKVFRNTRIQAISSNDYGIIPVLLDDTSKIVVHALPITFNNYDAAVDLSVFNPRYPSRWVAEHNLYYGHYNLDGFVRQLGQWSVGKEYGGYTQVFRTGTLECVHTLYAGDVEISLYRVENITLEMLKEVLIIQQNLGVQLPLVTALSLTNVHNRILLTGDPYKDTDNPRIPIARNNVLLPEIVLESYPEDLKTIVKPLFDMLWNVAGLERSLSYEGDKWVRRK